MFEGPVTGNIPEVLDNGEVTDGTHVTAGQLALALTPYAQVADLAVIQSLDDRVTAELASKLDSSALAPAIAPLATAAALATTAAHGSSIAALQSSLTTGLSNKADQSAFDVLEGVVATKSTPDGVDLKLSNYSTTAAMNGVVYDPLYGSFVRDQGAWSTAKMYFTVPPNGVAKLDFGAHFQAPGLPNQTAGTVDVYGLQILDATLETVEEEDTAASALLLKHEFLDGGADDVTLATLGEVLLEPTLTTLGNFLVRSNSQSSGLGELHGGRLPAGGLRHDPERLRLEHRAHLHPGAGETLLFRLPVPAGHGLQPGAVRQRGRQRLRGRHRHLPRHALAGSLEHGAAGLLGAAGRNREAALRSLRRVYPRPGAAVGGHAGPVQHADQGQRL